MLMLLTTQLNHDYQTPITDLFQVAPGVVLSMKN